jgi:hypothetical protein
MADTPVGDVPRRPAAPVGSGREPDPFHVAYDRDFEGTLDLNDSGDEAMDPVESVRRRLAIDDAVPDVTIAASLAQIVGHSDPRSRWLAAFGSPLGKHLAVRGGDLTAALNVVLAIAARKAV